MQHGAHVKLRKKGSQKRRKVGHLTSVDFFIFMQSAVRKKGSPKWLGSLDANRGTRILSLGGTKSLSIHVSFIHTYHFIHYISASSYSKLWEYTWVALLRSQHSMKCSEASFQQAVPIHR